MNLLKDIYLFYNKLLPFTYSKHNSISYNKSNLYEYNNLSKQQLPNNDNYNNYNNNSSSSNYNINNSNTSKANNKDNSYKSSYYKRKDYIKPKEIYNKSNKSFILNDINKLNDYNWINDWFYQIDFKEGFLIDYSKSVINEYKDGLLLVKLLSLIDSQFNLDAYNRRNSLKCLSNINSILDYINNNYKNIFNTIPISSKFIAEGNQHAICGLLKCIYKYFYN